jgi:glutamate carboxypeptidase
VASGRTFAHLRHQVPVEVLAPDLLREIVELESPTYSPGVRRVAEVCARELEALGARTRFLDGDHLVADLEGDGPPLLLVGHTDTVWPEGTLAAMPFRVENGRAYGPGTYDMKGCLVVLVEALRLAADRTRAVRVFLTADEEMGSRTARPHLEREAKACAAAFVVEPPGPSGNLKTARKGLGRFRLTITGRPAHAGTHREEGISAIEELAHQVLALHALNDGERGVSVNVGVVRGGTTENVVAAEAQADVDIRVARHEDRERLEAALASLQPHLEGAQLVVSGGWTRPPLEPTAGGDRLLAAAQAHGRTLGLELEAESSGGGSDANLVAAAGVPVIDGLGAEGGGAHAPDEHVTLDSIPVRARLLSLLLRSPGL